MKSSFPQVCLFSLNLLTIQFAINAIQVKNQDLFSLPDCYQFDVKVRELGC